MWDAWDRHWLLRQARGVELYSLCTSDGDYLRRSGAVFVTAPVTFSMVQQLRSRPRPRGTAVPQRVVAKPAAIPVTPQDRQCLSHS